MVGMMVCLESKRFLAKDGFCCIGRCFGVQSNIVTEVRWRLRMKPRRIVISGLWVARDFEFVGFIQEFEVV